MGSKMYTLLSILVGLFCSAQCINRMQMVDLETFMQSDFYTIGISKSGTLGTAYRAPSGYPTNAADGLLRAGIFPLFGNFSDIVLQGRSVEGFSISHDDQAFRNYFLNGYEQVRGNSTNNTWIGVTSSNLKINQTITLQGVDIVFNVVLQNLGNSTLNNLRYMRSVDPDQNDVFDTKNTIRERNVTAQFKIGKKFTGPVFSIGTDDVRSFGDIVPFLGEMNPALITRKPVNTTTSSDDYIRILFELGNLNARAQTSVQFKMRIDGVPLPSTTGVQTTGRVQSTGVQSTGVQSTGVRTTGIQTTGVQTTGVQTTAKQTTGVQTTGVQTTGVQTTGVQTTGVQTTGSGVQVPNLTWYTNGITGVPGAVNGTNCLYVNEPKDGSEWKNNWLCSNENISSWRWSHQGAIAGLNCIQWTESTDRDGWNNNFLCIPFSDSRTYTWSESGAIVGMTCTQIIEPIDPKWNDNFFCVSA